MCTLPTASIIPHTYRNQAGLYLAAGREPKPRDSPWLPRDNVAPFLF